MSEAFATVIVTGTFSFLRRTHATFLLFTDFIQQAITCSGGTPGIRGESGQSFESAALAASMELTCMIPLWPATSSWCICAICEGEARTGPPLVLRKTAVITATKAMPAAIARIGRNQRRRRGTIPISARSLDSSAEVSTGIVPSRRSRLATASSSFEFSWSSPILILFVFHFSPGQAAARGLSATMLALAAPARDGHVILRFQRALPRAALPPRDPSLPHPQAVTSIAGQAAE